MHWLIACIHFHAVIDRVEPPFVVLEWVQTGSFSDVPHFMFPEDAKEGDGWLVHIRTTNDRLRPSHWHRSKLVQLPTQLHDTDHRDSRVRFSPVSIHRLQQRLGAPTRSFMGADKRRHESTTSNQRVGVSLSDRDSEQLFQAASRPSIRLHGLQHVHPQPPDPEALRPHDRQMVTTHNGP